MKIDCNTCQEDTLIKIRDCIVKEILTLSTGYYKKDDHRVGDVLEDLAKSINTVRYVKK